MSPLTAAISAALVHSLWQDSMVAGLLWLALAALRGHSANARYATSCAGLGFMVLLPITTTAVLYARAFAPEIASESGAGTARAVMAFSTVHDLHLKTSLAIVQEWALPVWSVGVLLCSLRLLVGGGHALVLRRRSEPADEALRAIVARIARRTGVERSVHVLMSAMADGPATLGWLRPVILLPPATVLGLTPQQLEAVLAHELAHIRRHDYLVNVLQVLLETLLFYHPAVWWASRRVRVERESCCDDVAVGSCGDALCYAQALTKVASLRLTAASLAVGAASGPLVRRIERLLGGTAARERRSQWPAALALSLALASAALNVTWIRAQTRGDHATGVGSGGTAVVDGAPAAQASTQPPPRAHTVAPTTRRSPDADTTPSSLSPPAITLGALGAADPTQPPTASRGESTIVGKVTDVSDVALEGVVIEVASDALPEASRTTTTDGAGLYHVSNLPAGTYIVTFRLMEYVTFRREGLEVKNDSTATVNAKLKDGRIRD
jgi:beta-lactamase regulating signal transducer with metallopeptidase domain